MEQVLYFFENLPSGMSKWAITSCILYVALIIINTFKQKKVKATIKTEETLEQIVQSMSAQVDVHIRLLEFNLKILLTGPARLLLTLPIVDAYNISYDDSHPFLDGWRGQLESVLKIAQQQCGHSGTPIDCLDIMRAIQANETDYFNVLYHDERGPY